MHAKLLSQFGHTCFKPKIPIFNLQKFITNFIFFFVSVAVVVAFFLCWAPFHAQRLVAIYGTLPSPHNSQSKSPMLRLYEVVTYVSGVLYYLSTTINPMLYHLMSNKFRSAFKVFFT